MEYYTTVKLHKPEAYLVTWENLTMLNKRIVKEDCMISLNYKVLHITLGIPCIKLKRQATT